METIIIIIISAGILGGLAKYIKTVFIDDSNNKKIKIGFLIYFMVFGIIASALVPLFLNTISSTLISDILKPTAENPRTNEVLILIGFCLIASIFSDKFIQNIYDKVMSKKVENLEKTVEDVIDSTTEKGNVDYEKSYDALTKSAPTKVNSVKSIISPNEGNKDEIINVIKALNSGRYYSRTDYGIANETKISLEKVKQILVNLLENRFVDRIYAKTGKEVYWKLTQEGKEKLNLI